MPQVFVDTNIFIEATNRARMHYKLAQRLIAKQGELCTSVQVLREYLVVSTRPVSVNGLGMTRERALENVDLFCRRVAVLAEEKPIWARFSRIVSEAEISGKSFHDAWIVATMLSHRVKAIVTQNTTDFARFSDRIEIQPLTTVA